MASNEKTSKFLETPEPVELLIYDVNMKWKIHPEGAAIIKSITVPMYVVAIIGEYRSGKSYLMNRLAGANAGFSLGSTLSAETKGIWLMVKKHPTISGACLVLLDSEGLGDVEKGDQTHDVQIFTLTLLLCNSLLFNTMHKLEDAFLRHLQLVSDLASRIQAKKNIKKDLNEQYLLRHFPHLYVVIRDSFLYSMIDGKTVTSDEYLEISLKSKPGDGPNEKKYNGPRESIRNLFKNRACVYLRRPVTEEEDLTQLDQPGVEIREKFLKEVDLLKTSVIKNTRQFKIGKRDVHGGGWLLLAEEYARAMNEGAVPCIQSSRDAMMHKICEASKEDALAEYMHTMEKVCGQQHPLSRNKLSQYHTWNRIGAISKFENNGWVEPEETQTQYMLENMENSFKQFKAKNNDRSQELSSEAVKACFSELQTEIEKGTYVCSGGYEKYKSKKLAAKTAYQEKTNLGPCRDEVLAEYEEKLKIAEDLILSSDKTLTSFEKDREEREQELERQEERSRLQEEENNQSKREIEECQRLMNDKMQERQREFMEREKELLQEIKKLQQDIARHTTQEETVKNKRMQIEMLESERNENRKKEETSWASWQSLYTVMAFVYRVLIRR